MLGPEVAQAVELPATVIGQDIEETTDGRLVIAPGVAPDRVHIGGGPRRPPRAQVERARL
jgi:hypothetical protein